MTSQAPAVASSHPLPPAAGSPPAGVSPFPRLPVTVTPVRNLLTYYALQSLLLGPFFLFLLVPRYFRYHTMRYDVDEEGITMRWGILFRREISLTYVRIQDIHLSSNFVERWLGLARIQVQTASGSASAEMTVEGVSNYEAVRDFFYARMRGARQPVRMESTAAPVGAGEMEELSATLREVVTELRALRETLPARRGGGEDV